MTGPGDDARWRRRTGLAHALWRLGSVAAAAVQRVLPEQRAFRVRAWLYRCAGMNVHPAARICGTARFTYGNVCIGRDTFIGPSVEIYTNRHAGVMVGDHVDIAPGVMIHVGTHEADSAIRRAGTGTGEDVVVGDGTWVGARAVILYGTRIGRRCIVAPGSVVRGTFEDDALIAGIPAKVIKQLTPLPGVGAERAG